MILVTGGNGLLGTHILLALLSRGHRVRAMHRAGASLDSARQVFQFFGKGDLFETIEWCEGNVTDVGSLTDALAGCSAVIHTAAVVSYHRAERSRMYKVNVEGTANVVNAAVASDTPYLLHVSSIAALGRRRDGEHLDENATWADDRLHTHYGKSKYLGELEVWRGMQEGLKAAIINPGYVIGEGDGQRSSTRIISRLRGRVPWYPPGGTGMVSARDVARCAALLVEQQLHGERFVVVAENVSFKDYFRTVRQALGLKAPTRMATQTMLDMLALGEWFLEKITGRKATATRESVKNASLTFHYVNTKIQEQLQFQFETVEESVKRAVGFQLHY